MAISPLKQFELPPGLPFFYVYVHVPDPSIWNSKARKWLYFEVRAVSATDACLKAANLAVKYGHISRGESVDTIAETATMSVITGHHPWTRTERTVTPFNQQEQS